MTYQSGYQTRSDQRSLWDKIWRNSADQIVIFQWPNIWIIVWAAANFVSIVSPTRGFSKIMWWVGMIFILIWAGLEIVKGVNYFRRGLGVLVLLVSIASVLGAGF